MRSTTKIFLWVSTGALIVGVITFGVMQLLPKTLTEDERAIKNALELAVLQLNASLPMPKLAIIPKANIAAPSAQEIIARNAKLRSGDISDFRSALTNAVANFEAGTGSDREILKVMESISRPYEAMLVALDKWVAENEPNSIYAALIARGQMRRKFGWHARGTDYIPYTHEQNFTELSKWNKLAVEDFVAAIPKSKYPINATASLIYDAIDYSHADLKDKLYKAGEKIFPASEALFNHYSVGLFHENGGGSIPAAQAFLVRATKNGVPEDVRESVTQRLANIYANNYKIGEYRSALAYTIEQTKQKDNAGTWLARAEEERRAKLYEEALVSTQRALKHEPAHARALNEQAYILLQLSRPDEAKAARRLAADLGDNWAQHLIIDDLVWERNGETRDWVKIRAECEASAAMLNPTGQTCMGGMITDGVAGFTRDNAKEIAWYELAARQGDSKAQYNYGWMLYQGMGTKPDQEKGIFYLRNSARQGFDMALKKLIQLGERTDNLEWKASNWESFTRWVRRVKDRGIN